MKNVKRDLCAQLDFRDSDGELVLLHKVLGSGYKLVLCWGVTAGGLQGVKQIVEQLGLDTAVVAGAATAPSDSIKFYTRDGKTLLAYVCEARSRRQAKTKKIKVVKPPDKPKKKAPKRVKLPPDLGAMKKSDLVALADRHKVKLPGGYLTKSKLLALIRGQLG